MVIDGQILSLVFSLDAGQTSLQILNLPLRRKNLAQGIDINIGITLDDRGRKRLGRRLASELGLELLYSLRVTFYITSSNLEIQPNFFDV